MTDLAAIVRALNVRKNKLLDMAQAALPPAQNTAYRKLLLNELGKEGFERDLERIIAEGSKQERKGHGWPIYAGKEVRHE